MKKAGILVGATVAGLLALSPLAFATEAPVGDGGSAGIVNGANGNDVDVPLEACNNDVMGAGAGGTVKDATAAVSGAGSLVGNSGSQSHAEDQDARGCTQDSSAGDND